jgi:arginase family enzyme
MRVDILDLDGASVDAVPAAMRAQARYRDLRDLERPLRLWARREAMNDFRRRIVDGDTTDEPVVTLLGSGDYHHLAPTLIAQRPEKLTVFHFDNHPDWTRLAPQHHCGSWVNRALELDHVARVITIGPCSDDLVRPQAKGANLAALREGRVELYPWRHAPSFVVGRFGRGPSYCQKSCHLVWRNVADQDWQLFLDEVSARAPTEAVWLTIDKDVLRPEDALTNWDQGQMPLSFLLTAVQAIGRRHRVVGADICGDYSAPDPRLSWIKRWEMWTDHAPPPAFADRRPNVAANEALLLVLRDVTE